MRPGPRRTSATFLAALGLLAAGCAQGGIARRPMMVGTLKTELARVEQEKQLYRRQVAELEAENARIAGELTQERAFSTDLEARLADARELLDRRGLAADPGLSDPPVAPSYAERDAAPRARTQPAADAPRSRSRAPFAQISGGVRLAPAPRDEGPESAEFGDPGGDAPRDPPRRESPVPQGRTEPPVRWLPVADTTGG
jgi:hypothetical protein